MTPLFIEERQYYLNQFLIKMCELPFLCKTAEVQVFFRPKSSVESSFKALQKTSTDFVLTFYRQNIKVSNPNIPEATVSKYSAEIIQFVKDQKEQMDQLKNFKQHIKLIVPMKEEELNYYKQFAEFLNKYEVTNEKHSETNVKLISGDDQSQLKHKLDELAG